MKIELMKFVDYYAGIPACWLLTQYDRLLKLVVPRKQNAASEPKKIVLLKPAEMGTSVILYPVIERVKKTYPQAEFYFVAFQENVSIFEVLDTIKKENIFTLRTDSMIHMIEDTIKVLKELRRLKIDTIIDLEFFARYTTIFCYLTGASRRIGFHRFNWEGLYRGSLMTHKVPYNYYLHVGQAFMSLVLALGSPPGRIALKEPISLQDLKVPKIPLSEIRRKDLYLKLRSCHPKISEQSKLVIMSPNTGEWLPYRKWPIEHYAELCKKILAAYKDTFILITGTRSAVADAAYLMNEVADSRLIDLTCKTTLSEFIDLLNCSRVIVSVDSGPAHFACLTNIGIVCIFGPDTRVVFSPLSDKAVSIECGLSCHPCFSAFNTRTPNCDETDKACLRSIGVDSVFKEVIKFL